MTYEEAKQIAIIFFKAEENRVCNLGMYRVQVYEEALEIIKKAIEKQIPKKVVREAGKILYSCPNNRLHQMTVDKKGEFRYCSICGQALDWSDVK